MPLITITEAAKLVGKSTTTLNRHVKSGKISHNSKGKFDTEELKKVYGEFNIPQTHSNTSEENKEVNVMKLEQQLLKMESHLVGLQQRLEESEAHIVSLLQQLQKSGAYDVADKEQLSENPQSSMITFKADETEFKAFKE